jgi:hypothetical protein
LRLIKITEEIVKVTDSTFGNKTLYRDKIYLTYNAMAEKIVRANWGEIVGDRKALSLLPCEVLRQNKETKKVLFLFSGGFGDAISLGVLLNNLEKEYNLMIDVGCSHDVRHYILTPLGFCGKKLDCPVELEKLNEYDYIQPDVTDFISDQTRKRERSIPEELAKAYSIGLSKFHGDYHIPEDIEKRMGLATNTAVRIGISFESKGDVKSYPDELGLQLISDLIGIGFEVYRFGTQPSNKIQHFPRNMYYDYSGKTNIFELAALVKQMDIVVGMDSFAVHLSNILDVRTIALLSTTASSVYRCHNNVVCFQSQIDCAPCGAIEDVCPKGYKKCEAFYHPSVNYERIIALVVRECTEFLRKQFRAA